MKKLLSDTLAHWKAHNAPRMGAALSYYAMLSFIPLLLLVVTLVSYLFNQDLVQGTIITELGKLIGRNAAYYIDQLIRSNTLQNISLTAALISAGVTIFGAIGVFGELDADFDVLWDTPQQPKVHHSVVDRVWKFFQSKIIAFSFIPLLALLILISIIITIFFGAIQSTVTFLPGVANLIELVRIFVPLVLGTLLFTITFRILPTRKLPWRILFRGAFITTVFFIVGNFLILEYIKLLVHTDVFGGAASLVGLLIWIYYSSQIFFFGASFTYIYAKKKHLIPSRD